MDGKTLGATIAVLVPPTDSAALKVIREIAKNSAGVFFTEHAKRRMRERGVVNRQVLDCLRHGKVDESAARDIQGNWKCTLRHFVAGQLIRVSVACCYDEKRGTHAVVVTVIV